MKHGFPRTPWLGLLSLVAACADPLADTTSRVDAPRVLAIRAVPAEVAPNQAVRLEALFAGPNGVITPAPLAWTFCTARKPLAELGPVARECLDFASDAQLDLGTGDGVDARVPRDACQRFGPNPPPPVPGEPNGRPVDPDPTGGYTQPALAFRTDDPGVEPTLSGVRIACGLSNAPSQAVSDFNQRYRRNQAPTLASLGLVRANGTVAVPRDGAGPAPALAPGERVTLEVAWPACPEVGVCGDGICSVDETRTACAPDCTTPLGCGGAETYLRYDASTQSLVTAREAIRVAWFATSGSFDEARTGRASEDRVPSSANAFAAPDTAGEVVVYAVLRDDRGGVSYDAFRLTVTP